MSEMLLETHLVVGLIKNTGQKHYAARRKMGVKIGFRKPSIKKSLRARTTGKYKRRVKRAINPLYGKKGVGFVKNPRKSIRNKVYKKTSFGLSDILRFFGLK